MTEPAPTATVLVVDDDPLNRTMLAMSLGDAGFAVLEAVEARSLGDSDFKGLTRPVPILEFAPLGLPPKTPGFAPGLASLHPSCR